jgi:hypothetical protein
MARHRAIALAAALLAGSVLYLGVQFGSTVAGGSDSYGYVSQAERWRTGRLVQQQDIVRQSPWPLADETWSPLGYRPRPDRRDTIVPLYPVGLPLLMALFQVAAGYCAAFLVVPCCGALLVWLTFVLGVRLFDTPLVALLGAVLVAASPVFLYQLMNPMSDVPAAAAWTLALVLAVAGWPLSSGVAMGALLMIRPNLAPLALVLLVWTAMSSGRSAVRVALAIVPAVVALLIINARVYGSPFASGYGRLSQYYSWRYAATNVWRYTAWLVDVQTPVIALAGLYFVAPSWFPRGRIPFPRALAGGTFLIVLLSYLVYLPFDAWWYLRFFLPVWPLLMLLTAAGLDAVVRRALDTSVPPGDLRPLRQPPSHPRRRKVSAGSGAARWATRLACAIVGLLAWHGVRVAVERSAFDLARGDRRYVNVARFVAAHTDPNAVIFSRQHSGSLRLYAGRLTLRWDVLEAPWLDAAVAHLHSVGRRPYFVLEEDEVEEFKARFAGSSGLGALAWRPMAQLSSPSVFVYDPLDRLKTAEPLAISSIGESRDRRCYPPPERAAALP